MANIVELREMSDEQIEEMMEDAREELFNLRFQTATAQLEDYSRIGAVRRNIAQYREMLHKREMATEAALDHAEISSALAGKEWAALVRFDYEESAWMVEFTDDDGAKLASAVVNLNKMQAKSRRKRRVREVPQRVVKYELAG